MPQLSRFINGRFNLITGAVIFSLLCLAWHNRFIQDDAFISFRYADNLARGFGLVWNPGEHIEGYTNFLWTCIMSGAIYAHMDPILCSQILGMAFFFCSLLFTFKLSQLIFQSGGMGLLTILFLGTNYTFSCYATGGLETQMQASLFVMSAYFCLRNVVAKRWSPASLLLLSALLTCAVLTRLDSALLVVVIGFTTAVCLLREDRTTNEKFLRVALFVVPMLLCITCWFLWKRTYYGGIFPNTFYVKASSLTSIGKGFKYVYIFFLSYLLFPFPVIGMFAARLLFTKQHLPLLIVLLIIFAWASYVIKVGGDFMEFRFIVPVLPFIFILITWLIFNYIRRDALRYILAGLIFTGSLYHVFTFAYSNEDNIEPIKQLSGHLFNGNENWTGIGKILGEAFHDHPEVSIAVTAAGAIPFYSRSAAIDMLGMNDRWVAEHGEILGSWPGHQRIASLNYLMERKVNLVISHPIVISRSAPVTMLPMLPANSVDTLANVKIIELPLDDTHKLIVLYLQECQAIDDAIQRYHWKTHLLAKRRTGNIVRTAY